jgi:aspartate aminotransferase
MDPTPEQWAELSKTIKEKNLLPFFDCAYQGFASGNAPQDAFAIRMFVEDGHNLATVQSFSKNFGLYGQRVGALSIISSDEAEAKKVMSQMKMTIRPMYSNPPRYGANIVKSILSDERLTNDFIDQCKVSQTCLKVCRSQFNLYHFLIIATFNIILGMVGYGGSN